MTKIIARHRYDEYNDPGLKCTLEEKVTKESFKDQCDIDKIIERIARTGVAPDQVQKKYGDYSNVPDYQSALQIVVNAQAQFNSLDAHVRNRFNNDPGIFLEFASDSSNLDEMVKLGLATKREEIIPETKPQANAATTGASLEK